MAPSEPTTATTSPSSPSEVHDDVLAHEQAQAAAEVEHSSHQEHEHTNDGTAKDEVDPSASAPPLPDEEPPLPDEEPPSAEGNDDNSNTPPLPDEEPPLPDEQPPADPEDDGWQPVWEPSMQAFYFYNRFTGATQWTNPRVPAEGAAADAGTDTGTSGVSASDTMKAGASVRKDDTTSSKATSSSSSSTKPVAAGGYNPAIHGDYDPNAWYAQQPAATSAGAGVANSSGAAPTPEDMAAMYGATGAFNRFTGKWQDANFTTEHFSDASKTTRQLSAFYDVEAASNAHDGRSLRAERSMRKLTKAELKQFKEKRKAKKEERRRAWLMD